MPRMITAAEMSAIADAGTPTTADHDAWFAWLKDRHGTGDLPADVEARLYAAAWEHGHSSGYHDVAYWYGELAEVVLFVYNAR